MATLLNAVPAETLAAVDGLAARGIYRYEYKVEGCEAFFALTRNREVVGRGLRVVWPGDSEDDIIAELASELRLRDPVRPTYLRLHVADPAPPSKAITLREALDLETVDFARWLYQ